MHISQSWTARLFARRAPHKTTRPPLRFNNNLQRHQRQNKSSTTAPPTSEPSIPNASENVAQKNASRPPNHPPSQSGPSSSSSSTSVRSDSVASAAGAPTAPVVANTVKNASRSLRQIVERSPVGKLGRIYTRVQDKRPYATQVGSSVVVYLCGDLSAQLLFPFESPTKEASACASAQDETGSSSTREGRAATAATTYDPLRTLRHLTIGVVASIPSYRWFMFLHHNFNFSSKFRSILTKVTVQQIVYTPVFIAYFFSMQALLGGASLEETWERLKMAFPVSIKNSIKLWPAVTAFSFMYFPAQFRSVFAACVSVGWQTYLSWLNQKAAREVQAAQFASVSKTMTIFGWLEDHTLKKKI